MSKVIESFDFNKANGGRGYRSELFDRILDGQTHEIYQGEDFGYEVSIDTMRARIRQGAKHRQVSVRIASPIMGMLIVRAFPKGTDVRGGGTDVPDNPDPKTRKGAIAILRAARRANGFDDAE